MLPDANILSCECRPPRFGWDPASGTYRLADKHMAAADSRWLCSSPSPTLRECELRSLSLSLPPLPSTHDGVELCAVVGGAGCFCLATVRINLRARLT